jgi:hypothetical protein
MNDDQLDQDHRHNAAIRAGADLRLTAAMEVEHGGT